jgi:TRAP-type C4-dicarboxylate transport system substrate-binding protein
MLKKSIFVLLIILMGSLLVSGIAAATEGEVVTVKMSYNGPANIETNAVHEFAVNFKEFIEMGTNGRILINFFPDSQLGDEEQRMEQTMSDTSMINVASNAGMVSVYQEIYAATLPFMFKSFEAAHIFFDESDYWVKTKKEFREKTGVALLEAIEEGGFLAFTNNKKEIRSPADFKGLKFRGMDPGQVALYESFGASGIPIPWTELYMAIQTGVVDGQMNPPTYIISGNLYEVQDYMTMANIQYSCQWLTVNAEWLESLSVSDRYVIEQAAHAANIRNRISVEAMVNERVKFIEDTGVKVYYPNDAEMNQFQEIGQPGYTEWVKEKIDQKYVDLALESSQKANSEATVKE